MHTGEYLMMCIQWKWLIYTRETPAVLNKGNGSYILRKPLCFSYKANDLYILRKHHKVHTRVNISHILGEHLMLYIQVKWPTYTRETPYDVHTKEKTY